MFEFQIQQVPFEKIEIKQSGDFGDRRSHKVLFKLQATVRQRYYQNQTLGYRGMVCIAMCIIIKMYK